MGSRSFIFVVFEGYIEAVFISVINIPQFPNDFITTVNSRLLLQSIDMHAMKLRDKDTGIDEVHVCRLNRLYRLHNNQIVIKHIETETKWPPFSRRHFQMHLLEWECMNFDIDFTEVCF